MQPIAPLQRRSGKATSKKSFSFYRKQQGAIRTDLKVYSCIFYYLLHNGNGFLSGYLDFDIFNSNTFIGTIQQTDEK